jgi:hypothetical protein
MLFNPPGHFVYTLAETISINFEQAILKLLSEKHCTYETESEINMFLTTCILHDTTNNNNDTTLHKSASLNLSPQRDCNTTSNNLSPDSKHNGISHSTSVSFATDTCFSTRERSCSDGTTFTRTQSFDSITNDDMDTQQQQQDMDDECFQRPLLSNTTTTRYQSHNESYEVGHRAMCTLMSDLSKSIFRLKDDLFVVTFNKYTSNTTTTSNNNMNNNNMNTSNATQAPVSLKRCRSSDRYNDGEEEGEEECVQGVEETPNQYPSTKPVSKRYVSYYSMYSL